MSEWAMVAVLAATAEQLERSDAVGARGFGKMVELQND